MISQVDSFILGAAAQADTVMGLDTLTVSGGITLSGVWSVVTHGSTLEEGGFMLEADATLVVTLDTNVTKALVGKTGTAKGDTFRIVQVDIGETMGTLHLRKETSIL